MGAKQPLKWKYTEQVPTHVDLRRVSHIEVTGRFEAPMENFLKEALHKGVDIKYMDDEARECRDNRMATAN